MRPYLLFAVLIFSFTRCFQGEKNNAADLTKAQEVVNKAIEAHGGDRYKNMRVSFNFRERHYSSERRGGQFTYTRSFSDSTGQVVDVLTNNGFTRRVNGTEINLPAERKKAFTSSVNSVIYFALLPFGLNDAAVRKTYLGLESLRQQPYHKLKITFAQEGGGTDYQDTFVYWIHPEKYTVDYLAYSYQTEEGGLRFREAYNPVKVEGIRFQQYINYKPGSDTVAVTDLGKLYNAGRLEELSRIELENIKVSALK